MNETQDPVDSTSTPDLFSVHGIELEYAIVDADSLTVRPLAELLLREAEGDWATDHDEGAVGWSNELVAHQLELKTARPVTTLASAVEPLHASVVKINSMLDAWGARLLPTAMHPWMEPRREARLWSRDGHEIYEAYHRIFDCHRHGWANVQAVHLNLPFRGASEFGRLMAACRVVLPLLPALAASSPFVEGRRTGLLDSRVDFYRTNSTRVPSMAGEIIPEAVYTPEEYQHLVLDPIARELAPLDDMGTLAGNEWTNARGAIARFDRSAIEVRLLDSQECVLADLATCSLVTAVLQGIVERDADGLAQYPSAKLGRLLASSVACGREVPLDDPEYLELFGAPRSVRTIGELWYFLAEHGFEGCAGPMGQVIDGILDGGNLAERILRATGQEPGSEDLLAVYRELTGCLAENRLFQP